MNSDKPIEDPDQEVAELLSACDEAMASGEMPSSILILDDKDPQQSEIEKDLGCMNLLRMMWQKGDSQITNRDSESQLPATKDILPSRSTKSTTPHSVRLPKQIGRFEILSVLGSGGYGIVYLARDPMLLREVAIKAPRAEVMLQPSLKSRFLQEGRMAASLDHPNIVSVYEAAEADGVCYIASAFCPGVNLAKWMQQRTEPVPFHTAAAIVMQLADGVEHAHSRGIIHRDLKPGNVLFTPISPLDAEKMVRAISPAADSAMRARHEGAFDLGFIPKITDFGLAKAEMAESGHTISGTVAGTPEYMSPEQADGKTNVAGRASDVYSLGAILYELITGSPPFKAETPLATLHQVIHEMPVTPTKLRAKLPADLETICLKCLHKEPHQRYASAGDLADDLARFLNHEPIKARPVSILGQLTAWSRRKPVVAKLSAALLVVGVIGFAGVFWQWRRAQALAIVAQDERDKAWIERNKAVEAQRRAEANFERGKAVLDKLTALGNQFLNQPGMDAAARAVLEQTAIFYKGFLEDKSDDPKVRVAAGDAINQAARIHSSIHEDVPSLELHRQASDLYQGLVQEFPDRPGYQTRLMICLRDQARVLNRLGQVEESELVFDRAVAKGRAALQAFPTNLAVKNLLANVLMNRASQQVSGERDEHALEILQETTKLQQELIDANPSRLLYLTEIALTSEVMSRYYLRHGDLSQSLEEVKSAIEKWKKVQGKKVAPDDEYYLARVQCLMSQVLRHSGSSIEAQSIANEAHVIAKKLITNFPDRVRHQEIYSISLSQIALALAEQKKFAEANSNFKTALKYESTVPSVVNDFALYAVTCADPKSRNAKEAVEYMKATCNRESAQANYWGTLGIAHFQNGQIKEAKAAIEKSLSLRPRGSANVWYCLAMIRIAERNTSDALEPWRQGSELSKNFLTTNETKRLRTQLEAMLRKEKVHVD